MHTAQPNIGDGKHHIIHPRGDTRDIIRAIRVADKLNAPYVAEFAVSIAADNLRDTCYNIWKWIKDNIPYNEDPEGVQYIQSPGELYKNRNASSGGTGKGGDCKSYSNFISACLKNLGIKHFYRFISQEAGEDFHHVYICVPTGNGREYITVDPTPELQGGTWYHPEFSEEYPAAKKKDMWAEMPRVAKVSGARMAVSGPAIGLTNVELDTNTWANHEKQLKNNIDSLKNNLKQLLLNDIDEKWKGKPLRRSKMRKLINEAYGNLCNYGSALIYHFWDNNKAPFPHRLNAKRQMSREMADNLIEAGVSDANLRYLCNIGTYYTYGISMDYMLYRCYSMELYGQPWTPAPGVPYYNVLTKSFVNPGTTTDSLAKTIKIATCFPADLTSDIWGIPDNAHKWQGLGKPWGQPYWAQGGWVMANGASQEKVAAFVQQNPFSYLPQQIQANAANFTAAWRESAIALYNQWVNGNLPSFPESPALSSVIPLTLINQPQQVSTAFENWQHSFWNNDWFDGLWSTGSGGFASLFGRKRKPNIGIAPVLMAAIISAVVTVVVAILSSLDKIIAAAKGVPSQSTMPMPPPDFQMEYLAQNGCYVGTAPQSCPGLQAMYCPDGSFTCVTQQQIAANPGLAPLGGTNPLTGEGGFFNAGSPKTLLLLGAGLLGLAFLLPDNSKS